MTDPARHRILPLGDDCALIAFGNKISADLNDRVIALSESLSASPFEGFIETVPAYSSLAVYFDPCRVLERGASELTAFENVRLELESALCELPENPRPAGRQIEIPVLFGGEAGPDLGFVATQNGISETEVVEIFVSKPYRVFFLGFLPGFAYMGELDPKICAPRRDDPRTRVPAGSVGIAGNQTGIYPSDSPGGWRLIGRTDLAMFDPAAGDPAFLRPGDSVTFKAEGRNGD
jgi:inhibitor of KinA